jgi:hypothetical protein
VDSIDELLAPYQAVIDKLNEELGSDIYIPEKNKMKVYQNIQDMTPKEVEEMLRKEYRESVANGHPKTDAKLEETTLDELLAPYQAVIDKLNEELGSSISIPKKNRVKVYQNIKDKTPKEVEEMLRKEYQDYIADDSPNSGEIDEEDDDLIEDAAPMSSDSGEIYNNDDMIEDAVHMQHQDIRNLKKANVSEVKSPNAIREKYKQTTPIGHNSEMYLKSTVFTVLGEAGSYTYEKIHEYGSQWPSTYKGYHFEVDSGSYKLSSNKKNCTVTLTGHPQDANGFVQLLHLKATNTFNAG